MVNRAEETADLKTPLAQSQRPVLSGMLSVLLIFNNATVFVSSLFHVVVMFGSFKLLYFFLIGSEMGRTQVLPIKTPFSISM